MVPLPVETVAAGRGLTRGPRPALRRWLVPRSLVCLICFVRHRALVSPRAEVEYSPDLRLGPGCVISSYTKVKVAGPLEIGARVQVATGCFISAAEGGVTIGDDALIGPNCSIVGSSYRYDRLGVPCGEQGTTSAGVRIGRRVWIGANSAVLDGATIGDDVVVAAGSVVSGNVPSNTVVHGNPAAVIFTRR